MLPHPGLVDCLNGLTHLREQKKGGGEGGEGLGGGVRVEG